jgi:hypothetical protein
MHSQTHTDSLSSDEPARVPVTHTAPTLCGPAPRLPAPTLSAKLS